eukprot:4535411-Amphidinium_carterae.1
MPIDVFSYWPSGTDQVPDLLSESGIAKLKSFRRDNSFRPDSDKVDREWTHRFLTLVLRGEPLPAKFPD